MQDSTQPWCEIDASASPATLTLHGHWRLANTEAIWRELRVLRLQLPLCINADNLQDFDSTGALMLLRALDQAGISSDDVQWRALDAQHRRILSGVQRRLPATRNPPDTQDRSGILGLFARVGENAAALGTLLLGHLNFLGATLAAAAHLIVQPRQLRGKELTVQFEQVCVSALPVVALVTLLIGITIAYLLGLQAEKYGANIFVVDGVGIGMTREFAPIIVATIVAGRSGAAFTAQLGAMRLTEEIDAIRTLGLAPMQVLVLPRVLALVVALPLLVFVGDVMGILGAMLIADPLLGLTPSTVIDRLHGSLDITHFWAGLVKAPVFALFIAVIGCRMGILVQRDTRAVGLATTSTVVQSIVSVILLDAAFAVVFQELGI
ncbi:MAG: ABC transporter permease [Pseudomonadales bacterium]|nr:ABC transporter permease [Pseudomonadales bacterium]